VKTGLFSRFFGRATPDLAGEQSSQSQSTTINSKQAVIIPQHDKPRFLTPNGEPCYGAEEKYHLILFECFQQFGEWVNWWRDSTPFRLQELSDTRITYAPGELDLGPHYGRRYEIFYYQSKVGLLQICASGVVMTTEGLTFSEYITAIEDHKVSVDFTLNDPARTIPYDTLKGFLFNLASLLSSDQKDCHYTEHQYRGMTERGYAIYAIEQAMMRALWDNAPLKVHFSGTPTQWIENVRREQKANVSS
jgi:hypothetical protein